MDGPLCLFIWASISTMRVYHKITLKVHIKTFLMRRRSSILLANIGFCRDVNIFKAVRTNLSVPSISIYILDHATKLLRLYDTYLSHKYVKIHIKIVKSQFAYDFSWEIFESFNTYVHYCLLFSSFCGFFEKVLRRMV